MNTKEIRRMIEEAVKKEKAEGHLAAAIRDVAKQNGKKPSAEQVKGVVDLVREYVEHVPRYIEEAVAAAGRVGLAAEMAQMVAELEAYWLEPRDLIKDRFGLLGIMDDAYASLFLLQAASDQYSTAGHPLLKRNLTPANQGIRVLLGDRIAAHLEGLVGITIAKAMVQRVLQQFAGAHAFSFAAGPDPIWGNASMDDIVTARLGAAGCLIV